MARSTEVLALESAYRAAQARVGLATAALSSASWRLVSASRPAATMAPWIEETIQGIMAMRARSMQLARSYYILSRALQTGDVFGNPELPEGSAITLPALREHFLSLLSDTAQLGEGDTSSDPGISWVEGFLHQLDAGDPVRALLDRSDLGPYLDALVEAMDDDDPALTKTDFAWPRDQDERKLYKYLHEQLKERSVDALEKKLAKRATVSSAPMVQQRNQLEDHRASGSAGAGFADHAAISAGRAAISMAARADRRIMKVARGTSSTPCYFCAMLASRGFVYSSEAAASFMAHPNCHCYPIIRWVDRDVADPELISEFTALWNKEIQGKYSGNAALREWRKVIAARAAARTR